MHKIYEFDDVSIFFKKRYCMYCGKQLQTIKTEKIVKEDDPEHSKYCSIGRGYRFHKDILVIGRQYNCYNCNKEFSCDEQAYIFKTQKFYKRKIVSKEEISNIRLKLLNSSEKNIHYVKWFLIFPFIGFWICLIYIFNGILGVLTKEHDMLILIFSSLLLIFVGYFLSNLIINSLISLDIFADFLQTYKKLIRFIFSMYAFNLPILIYINKRFKI